MFFGDEPINSNYRLTNVIVCEPIKSYNWLMVYNWQQKDWPEFRYNLSHLEDQLLQFIQTDGQLAGMLKAMPGTSNIEALLNLMVSEAIKTSEIEGEQLNRDDVVSSIRNNLGINTPHKRAQDAMATGAGDLMHDVRLSFSAPLTAQKLFEWHSMLLESQKDVKDGSWRTHKDPMQVISGAMSKEKIHFEAPPSKQVPTEMNHFLRWFNATEPKGKNVIKHAPVRSAIAHLYFESIHPFEDGNGRIGRAIAEKALSQTLGHPVLISLSTAIERHKKNYYEALETAQRSNEITPWVTYFVEMVLKAQEHARNMINFVLEKSQFYNTYKNLLNERQLSVINRMLEEGYQGFKGGMNVRKYISLTQTSKATATRDLQSLVELKAFKPIGKARGTRYRLNMDSVIGDEE